VQIVGAGVTSNGSMTGGGMTARLYGIAFPDPKKICATASGERWPCGRRPYIALHNKVVGQTVGCAPREVAGSDAADCFLGQENLAVWLLRQGLVRLAPEVAEKEMKAAEAAARNATLGLWGDPRELAAATGQ
jgi:endonuclease YncB( thermonuclease family)